MRNFHRLAEGVNVMPLLDGIVRQPKLWNENRLRTTHPGTPHKDIEDIWLRFNDLKPYEGLAGSPEYNDAAKGVMDEHESICYPAWDRLPQAHGIIFDLMRRVEGIRLGRVLITRLAPGKKVDPHKDGGSHAAYYDRYHIILKNLPGSIFRAGQETVCMAAGECWWFDNAEEHEVINNSADDRLTMIVDIRSC